MDKTDFYTYNDWYRALSIADNDLTLEELQKYEDLVQTTDEFSFHWWPYLD